MTERKVDRDINYELNIRTRERNDLATTVAEQAHALAGARYEVHLIERALTETEQRLASVSADLDRKTTRANSLHVYVAALLAQLRGAGIEPVAEEKTEG